MSFERNTVDQQTVSVEEIGLINDGASDRAIATITGSYPDKANTYLCNDVSDMLITPISGVATVIVRSRDKRRLFRLDLAKSSQPIEILKGEGYCYSVDEGQIFVAQLDSTPPWSPDQYRTITHDD